MTSAHALAAHRQPDLIFNYLGQFDQVVAGSSLFGFAIRVARPVAQTRAPAAARARSADARSRRPARGALRLQHALHERETIERIAERSSSAAGAHCAQRRRERTTHASRRRTSLSRASTRPVWSGLTEAYPELEDVYPLSPMQRLFYSRCMRPSPPSASRSGGSRFEAPSTRAASARAWELLLERHAILRTAFTTDAAASRCRSSSGSRPALARGGPSRAAAEDARGAHSCDSRAGATRAGSNLRQRRFSA